MVRNEMVGGGHFTEGDLIKILHLFFLFPQQDPLRNLSASQPLNHRQSRETGTDKVYIFPSVLSNDIFGSN